MVEISGSYKVKNQDQGIGKEEAGAVGEPGEEARAVGGEAEAEEEDPGVQEDEGVEAIEEVPQEENTVQRKNQKRAISKINKK